MQTGVCTKLFLTLFKFPDLETKYERFNRTRKLSAIWCSPWIISALVWCTSYMFQTYQNTSSPTQRRDPHPWLYTRASLRPPCVPGVPRLLAVFFILRCPVLLPSTPWSALHLVGTQAGALFFRLFGTDLTLWMSASSPAHGIQSVHGEIFWMNKEWNRTFRQFAISKTHLHRYILNASEEKQSCVREINIPLP